jgi:predicted CoA-binding protein
MAIDERKLAALQERGVKLGYQVDTSMNKLGYCLWRVLPRVGRYLILGRDGGVTLEAIEKKLDEIDGDAGNKA